MGSFTAVVVGNVTLATDLNQWLNFANGVSNGQAQFAGGTATPLQAVFTAGPFIDTDWVACILSGDIAPRIGLYYRTADGYGGLRGGLGTSIAAHMHAYSAGWQMDESLYILNGLTVGGNFALNGSGTATNLTVGPGDGSGGPHLQVNAGFGTLNVTGDGGAMYLYPSAGGGFARNFYLGGWNGSTALFGAVADSGGNLATGIPYLRVGYQQSGRCGWYQQSGTLANDRLGQGVNYATQCSRTPASVSIATIENNRVGSLTIYQSDTYGFVLQGNATNAGTGDFLGTFSTNGQ